MKLFDGLAGMAELEDNRHHALIVVDFLGSFWEDIGGNSLIDIQDRCATGLDDM